MTTAQNNLNLKDWDSLSDDVSVFQQQLSEFQENHPHPEQMTLNDTNLYRLKAKSMVPANKKPTELTPDEAQWLDLYEMLDKPTEAWSEEEKERLRKLDDEYIMMLSIPDRIKRIKESFSEIEAMSIPTIVANIVTLFAEHFEEFLALSVSGNETPDYRKMYEIASMHWNMKTRLAAIRDLRERLEMSETNSVTAIRSIIFPSILTHLLVLGIRIGDQNTTEVITDDLREALRDYIASAMRTYGKAVELVELLAKQFRLKKKQLVVFETSNKKESVTLAQEMLDLVQPYDEAFAAYEKAKEELFSLGERF